MEWFLYDRDLRHERVLTSSQMIFITPLLDQAIIWFVEEDIIILGIAI